MIRSSAVPTQVRVLSRPSNRPFQKNPWAGCRQISQCVAAACWCGRSTAGPSDGARQSRGGGMREDQGGSRPLALPLLAHGSRPLALPLLAHGSPPPPPRLPCPCLSPRSAPLLHALRQGCPKQGYTTPLVADMHFAPKVPCPTPRAAPMSRSSPSVHASARADGSALRVLRVAARAAARPRPGRIGVGSGRGGGRRGLLGSGGLPSALKSLAMF